MSRLSRDGTAEPVSRDQIVSANGDGEISVFPVQLTTRRIGSLTRLIPTLAMCSTKHTTTFRAFFISLTQSIAVCIVYNNDTVAGVDTYAHIILQYQYWAWEKRGAQ